jgi:lipopolysaccharide export system protein LptC
MARATGLHSRLIAWAKIVLPLLALGLLSTIFLLSDRREPMETVPFAEALQDGETTREGISGPQYAGKTTRGDLLTMSATRARPQADGSILAEDLTAAMRLIDGGEILLDALSATLPEDSQTARLQGGVRIRSSDGYVLDTEALTTALDRIEAESLGPVSGAGPLGTLEAGRMRITAPGGDSSVQLLFTEGVKLVYQPPEPESAAE